MAYRYIALGPVLSGEGSRAFLGLRIGEDNQATPCVLVWVPEEVMADPAQVESLRRETARAARLDHPNLIRVYGLVDVDEGLARVVSFADGESLRRVLERCECLPPALASRVVLDAAQGVEHALVAGAEDGAPYVHGDIRPETILVSYSGVTKVSGYGALTVAPKEMGGKRVLGRRKHCAPEQILGGRAAVTEQTDVYLLGLLLLEALTGLVPFVDEKDFDKAVLNKAPSHLHSEYVPSALRPVIAKALEKKGSQRYPTVKAFREAVEAAAGEEVADHADFGAFLYKTFSGDDARVARRRELENGIQEWVAKNHLKLSPPSMPPPPTKLKNRITDPMAMAVKRPEAAPVPAPASAPAPASPEQVHPPSAPAPVSTPSPVPVAAAPAPKPAPVPKPPPVAPVRKKPRAVDPEDEEPAPRKKGLSPWAVVVPLLLMVAGGAFWMGQQSGGGSLKLPGFVPSPPPPEPVAVVDAGAPFGTVEPVLHAVDVVPDAGAEPAAVAPVEESKAAPRPSAPVRAAPVEKPTLSITVDPPVEVSIDGKPAGKTPLKVELAAGKHRVVLADASIGLRLVKMVNVRPGANELSLSIGKGTVAVNCPPGAEVRIDGKLVGKTPLPAPVPVVEGSHRIKVSAGGAHWEQTFDLGANERMDFDVHIDAP